MKKHYHFIAVDECLVDFVASQQGNLLMLESYSGGAPVNVPAMAALLGLSTATR